MYTFDQGEVIEVGAHEERAAALPYIAPFDCLLLYSLISCKGNLRLLCRIGESEVNLHRPSSSHGA